MITRIQVDSLIKSLPKTGLKDDEWRTAASVVTGASYGKSLPEIITFYHVDKKLAEKWWDFFNFDDLGLAKSSLKKYKPQKILLEYVQSHIGDTVSVKIISEICNVSPPSVYAFIDSHRGWFKKESRGKYTIIDEQKERKNAKQN